MVIVVVVVVIVVVLVKAVVVLVVVAVDFFIRVNLNKKGSVDLYYLAPSFG